MRTLLVSDLHLGAGTNVDLLRNERIRDRLLNALEGADRLILLGDVVELRERPLGEALELSMPFFEKLGEAAGDAELVIVPGNHDHHFLEEWMALRRLDRSDPLGLAETAPAGCGGPLVQLARATGNPNASIAYPGVWVRDDVYATHGHYLDRHLTIPTFERLALAAVERALGPPPNESSDPLDAPEGPTDPDEYERALTPVYAFLFALAQGSPDRRGPGPSARIWAAMSGGATRAQKLRGWLLGSVAVPSAVGMANRFGLGPVKGDLSPGAITRAGLAAMREVIGRLGIDADYVIFGHTHRRGPLEDEPGWTTTNGPDLINSGSWTHMPGLIGDATPTESPYWPGTVIEVGDSGRPEARLLLDSFTRSELTEATTELTA